MGRISIKTKCITAELIMFGLGLSLLIQGVMQGVFGLSFFTGLTLIGLGILSYVLVVRELLAFRKSMTLIIKGAESTSELSLKNVNNYNELVRQATEQAGVIASYAPMMGQMDAAINQTSENAQNSLTYVNESNKMAREGTQVVANLVSAMAGINNANTSLEKIISMITDINKKTTVINDIVFETKLLSFNASIEAARAGQYGKGFAVVAQEIGSLAQMSGKAAEEISSLLDTSTNQVRDLISQNQDRVREGEKVAKECERVFERISENIPHVVTMVNNISSATKEQQEGVTKMSDSRNSLDSSMRSYLTMIRDNLEFVQQVQKQSNTLFTSMKTADFIFGKDGEKIAKPKSKSKNRKSKIEELIAHKVLEEVDESDVENSDISAESRAKEIARLYKPDKGQSADFPSANDSRFGDE